VTQPCQNEQKGSWWSHHPWRCSKNIYGTSGHGLEGVVVMGWWLDLVILEVFSNLNNSMIFRAVSREVVVSIGKRLRTIKIVWGICEENLILGSQTLKTSLHMFLTQRQAPAELSSCSDSFSVDKIRSPGS